MKSAPCASRTLPRRTALLVFRQTLSRYHESGDKLITPIIAVRELKSKWRPPMENALTRAFAASRFLSSSSPRYSSVNILKMFQRDRSGLAHSWNKKQTNLHTFLRNLSIPCAQLGLKHGPLSLGLQG